MIILQLIQSIQARGAEIHAARLSNALMQNGHKVYLVSLVEGDFNLGFNGEVICLDAKLDKRFWDIGAWARLSKLIKDLEIDFIQANGADTLKYAVISKKMFFWKAKIIFYNGSMVSSYIHSSLVKIFNNLLYSQVNRVIAVSESVKIDFIDTFSNLHSNQAVIPAGFIRNSLYTALPIDFSLYVHIGGFTFEKNHMGLIRIFDQIKIQQPNAQLWLIGDGPLKKEIEKVVSEKSYSNDVLFLGAISNPFSIIPGNAIIILPSLVEGLPTVVLEAINLKFSVIAYEVGELPAFFKALNSPYAVLAANEGDFISKALSIQSEIDDLEKERMVNYIKDHYTIEALLPFWESEYQNLLLNTK